MAAFLLHYYPEWSIQDESLGLCCLLLLALHSIYHCLIFDLGAYLVNTEFNSLKHNLYFEVFESTGLHQTILKLII
jgi:hypothetical protein